MEKKENSFKVLLFGSSKDKGLKQYKATGNMDIVFLILVMYLVVMGTIMMFSAGYVKAESESGDPLSFLKKQILFLAIGIPVMLLASRVKPEIYKKYSVIIFLFALFTLVVVLFYHTIMFYRHSLLAFDNWISAIFLFFRRDFYVSYKHPRQ